MLLIGRFTLIASILLVSVTIIQQASSLYAWFVYVTLAWALSPYIYLSLQLRSADTSDEVITRSVMALATWLAALYISWQSWRTPVASEDQLLWLFGPLLQWMLMALVAMLMAIILIRSKRKF